MSDWSSNSENLLPHQKKKQDIWEQWSHLSIKYLYWNSKFDPKGINQGKLWRKELTLDREGIQIYFHRKVWPEIEAVGDCCLTCWLRWPWNTHTSKAMMPEICSVHFGGEKGRGTCVSASSLDPQPQNTWMNVMETWQSPNRKAEISHQFQVLDIKHLGS